MKEIIELLGKQVSFIEIIEDQKIIRKGLITDVCLNKDGKHQISLDDDDFYVLNDCLEFIVGI
jgi:hypothetical protein